MVKTFHIHRSQKDVNIIALLYFENTNSPISLFNTKSCFPKTVFKEIRQKCFFYVYLSVNV